ncbi:MAG: hypothetical protein EZS28_001516 [Streblomastix strix]|uniref:Uncharacterized protein n=1 Tax=Streblomastix strix TaxID=222440 RepID=A0A5J4X7E3_9EUKA|nr:MAG: hypothetical protein EZS28_001516 [Streblomastix strix]
MQGEAEENFKILVKENEGIDVPRFSTIQTSLSTLIDPKIIQRIQERNVNDQLNGPNNQMGSMAQPPNPDTQLKDIGEIAHKEYVDILNQTDREQQSFKTSSEEDALDQQIYDQQDNIQCQSLSASVRQNIRNSVRNVNVQKLQQQSQFIQQQMQEVREKDQLGEDVQEQNVEITYGLKYAVGSIGWGKQPINAYFNQIAIS